MLSKKHPKVSENAKIGKEKKEKAINEWLNRIKPSFSEKISAKHSIVTA